MPTPSLDMTPAQRALRLHNLRLDLAQKLELSRSVLKHESEKLCREISELYKQIRELE